MKQINKKLLQMPAVIVRCHRLALLVLALLYPTVPQNAAGATLVAQWDFEGNWSSSNDPSYNLTPSGPVNLTISDRGRVADYHSEGHFDPNSPLLNYADSAAQPTSASFNSGFSAMGWVYLRGASGCYIASHQGSFPGQGYVYGFQVYAAPSNVLIHLADTSDHRLEAISQSNDVTSGKWQHIACTWDGATAGGMQIYVNGQPVPFTYQMGGTSGAFRGLDGGSMPVRVGGSHVDSSGRAWSFDGMLDHVTLWQGALNAQEVLHDYESTASPTDGKPLLTITPAVRIEMRVIAGQNYQLQVSPGLESWTNLGAPFTATSTTNVTYVEASPAQQFFRLQLVP